MIKSLLEFGLTRSAIIVLGLAVFCAAGLVAFSKLNIEAYPNPAPVILEITAQAAGLSPAHFSRAFRKAFGESPHAYLLTRRLERAAALLRTTDNSVADICIAVGLTSIGSFTTSFKRMFGATPPAYRASFPPASTFARVPACLVRAYSRPQLRTFREDGRAVRE